MKYNASLIPKPVKPIEFLKLSPMLLYRPEEV